MAIIEEGRGNHFDPAIVDAVANASDEVRRVMQKRFG